MIAIDTRNTLTVSGAWTTEWRIATTARMVALVADRAATGDTLAETRLITIGVCRTAHAGRAICSIDAEGCVAITTGVGGHIAGHARLVNALLAIAIGVAITLDTPAAVG